MELAAGEAATTVVVVEVVAGAMVVADVAALAAVVGSGAVDAAALAVEDGDGAGSDRTTSRVRPAAKSGCQLRDGSVMLALQRACCLAMLSRLFAPGTAHKSCPRSC